jgi:hypothetical protein
MCVTPAFAVKRSGNDILVDCTNLVKTESIEAVSQDKVLGMGYCIGLIDGFVTFNYVYESILRAGGQESDIVQMCLPDRVSTRQLADVIIKYLESNPDKLQQAGQALAAQALVDAYPCTDPLAEKDN